MKERPILMSTPMVQAILDGRKTQTRRIIKPMNGLQKTWLDEKLINKVPHGELIKGGWQMHHPRADTFFQGVYVKHDSPLGWIRCPYGEIGDILWVRETWIDLQKTPVMGAGSEKYIGLKYWYRADNTREMEVAGRYKPSIFMPKAASRIKLEITDIRVERLNDISRPDIIAEGLQIALNSTGIGTYAELWENINGEGSWDKNPWVWVIEFKKLKL